MAAHCFQQKAIALGAVTQRVIAQLAAVQECVKECERYNPLGYCGPICAAAVDLGTALIGGVSCSNASDVYELASEFKPIDSFFSFQMQQ